MKTSKRILSLILCCIMVISLIPMTVSAGVMHIYYGDINENGRVEASDARLVLQKAASLITLTDRQMALADVNQDGRVSAMDARTVLRTAARIEAPAVFETNGTEDDTVDYLGIYSEFLRNQGKTTTENTSMDGEQTLSFSDAVICDIISDNNSPELVVLYYKRLSHTAYYTCKIFAIENREVVLKKTQSSGGGRGSAEYFIWKDPATQKLSVVEYYKDIQSKFTLFCPDTIILATVDGYDNNKTWYNSSYSSYFRSSDENSYAAAETNIFNYLVYKMTNAASEQVKINIINKDGSIEEKSLEESEQTDPVMMYAEFIRKQGKTRKIYSDMINKTNTFIYWDSAVCKLDKDSDVPNMILIYYNDNIQNDPYQPFPCYNIEIYTIKDGKVELVHSKQFIEAYCRIRFDLWRDPTTNSFELTEYDTFEGCSFSLCYPTDKELFANNWGMDNPYYAPGYEKYFTDTNIITHIDKYSAYTFSNTTSDSIRISVIDDNSNVETKTFDF